MIMTIMASSAKQSSLRECVSTLLDVEDETVLFDIGSGVISYLARVNRKASEVNKLIMAHIHGIIH